MNGAAIDGSWYLAVLGFAGRTPWLHGILVAYTDLGLVLFGLALVAGWWWARRAGPRTVAAALCAPFAVLLGYLLSNLVKVVAREPRPCRSIGHLVTLLPCPAPTDFAFPSNHAVLAASVAVTVSVTWRRVTAVAVILALLMGFSRVYVGVHYPHDVLAGFALGVLSGVAATVAAPRLARTVRAARARPWSRLAWWVGPGPAAW